MRLKHLLTALAAAGAMVLGAAGPASAQAPAKQPNILVMGEDDDPDTVPRNHRVFDRVIQALSMELGQMGFRVYDETAVSLDVTRQGRIRRNDSRHVTGSE